jgi:hypothetical protein
MTPAAPNFWEALFTAPTDAKLGFSVPMRLMRKAGRPFLLLPAQSRAAAATISLYPAQTSRARMVRTVLRLLLRAGLAPRAQTVMLAGAFDDPFAKHLSSLAGNASMKLPPLGILAGNPMSEGQRFLVLVFDGRERPVAVAKAGFKDEAKALIEREAAFLATVPAGTTGVPRLRTKFESPHLRALALDFFAGDSPRAHHEAALPALLETWVDRSNMVKVADTSDWARLRKRISALGAASPISDKLGEQAVRPTISHGDLTPWNVKVSPTGDWTVLDWERGELRGIPGWDWFHYVIQSAILVGHEPVSALVSRVERLLASGPLRHYAAHAGIVGCERKLLLAYLLHMIEVIKPSEGRGATRELLRALSERWVRA